jgi:hypothetical protein
VSGQEPSGQHTNSGWLMPLWRHGASTVKADANLPREAPAVSRSPWTLRQDSGRMLLSQLAPGSRRWLRAGDRITCCPGDRRAIGQSPGSSTSTFLQPAGARGHSGRPVPRWTRGVTRNASHQNVTSMPIGRLFRIAQLQNAANRAAPPTSPPDQARPVSTSTTRMIRTIPMPPIPRWP